MKRKLTEAQLRNIVYNTIKESVYGNEMYFIEDEGDGAIYANVPDKDEAIADAQEMAANGGRFLVKDRNDEVIFDTGGPSYKFESIKESQMREIVASVIRENLEEYGLLDRMYMAHIPNKKDISNPTVVDIMEKDGWEVQDLGNGRYQITQKTGAFGNTEGTVDLDELINDELNQYYFKGQKRASIVSRSPQFGGQYDDEAEKAIIQIR